MLYAPDDAIARQETAVSFISPQIARITKSEGGKRIKHAFQTITEEAQGMSYAPTVKEEGGCRYYETPEMKVVLAEDGSVKFLDKDGKVLLEESGDGPRSQAWKFSADEAIYGLGDNQTLDLDMRGWEGTLMPRNVGDGVSVFTSTKGYAVYWDNTSPVKVKQEKGTMAFTSDIGDVDYYFMFGGDLDGAVALIREISGDVPMLPRWAYGFWQSKERYKTQDETVSVVKKHRELGIPLDGIVQDWQYWGCNCLWNAMDFMSPDFREPKKMIDDVHAMNAKLLISIWQSFGPQTQQYRELKEKGLLFPFETWPSSSISHVWPPLKDEYPSGVRLYDAYSAEARDIYWKHLTRLFDLGVDAWWMDSTDPDHIYKEGDLEYQTSLGCTWREVRSAYPVACTKGVYEHMRGATDKRVFILTRGAGLGEQRYAASVWSGDTGSSWDVLRRQIPGGLNYTMTGNPNFNCDLGGFFSGRYRKGGGIDNPNWRELFVRWMQLGTFLPMMRNHGADLPHEIFLYGKAGESVYDALVGAVRLRYRLMPYIYSLGGDVTRRRASFMRPLAADFPTDRATWNIAGEFLMGREILVAPVLNALYTNEDNKPVGEMEGWDLGKAAGKEAGAKDQAGAPAIDWTAEKLHRVYLPKGADWWCFKTAKKIAGGQSVEFPVTLMSQPFFVKAGSILPLGPDVQYNGEKKWDDLEVRIYPGADGAFTLYEDDFETYACESGEFTEIDFTWNDAAKELTIAARHGAYPEMLRERTFRFVLPDGTETCVVYTGERTVVGFNEICNL